MMSNIKNILIETFTKRSLFSKTEIGEEEDPINQSLREPSEKELLMLEKAKEENEYIEKVKSFFHKNFNVEVIENNELTRLDVHGETILETKDRKTRVHVEMQKDGFAFVTLSIGPLLGCRWKVVEKDSVLLWEEVGLTYSDRKTIAEKTRKILYFKFAPEFLLVTSRGMVEVSNGYNKVKTLLENKYQISLQNYENNPTLKQLEAVYQMLLGCETVLSNDQEIINVVEPLYKLYEHFLTEREHNQMRLIMSI